MTNTGRNNVHEEFHKVYGYVNLNVCVPVYVELIAFIEINCKDWQQGPFI